jgi:uncharacterized protein YdeI (YjbR/CyaY-like superfamily)
LELVTSFFTRHFMRTPDQTTMKRTSARLASQAAKLSAASSTKASVPASADTLKPQTLFFRDVTEWEQWLESNHENTAGVWIKMAKKATGIPSITHDEALDAALCWGWIDGQRKGLDAEHFLQRFTPRRQNSLWSKRNCEKIASLMEAGRMRPPGLAEVDKAKASGRWEKAYPGSSAITVPDDFQAALDKNPRAKTFFEGLGKTKRWAFLYRIATTKRAETRQKKIEQFVGILAEGKTLT